MKFALVNPRWTFTGSTYFGCPEPHLPIELLMARETLHNAGQDVLLVDAFLENLDPRAVHDRLRGFDEDFLVIPTAPSYLFWRCPQPELRVPHAWFSALGGQSKKVILGPHGSATPEAALRKTASDIALRGEPDQTLPELARQDWHTIPGCCWLDPAGEFHGSGAAAASDMSLLPVMHYAGYPIEKHLHKHHIFPNHGADHLRLGAEVEFARGCPYACSFCNKTLFRNRYRERPIEVVLAEVDQLIARGVDYIYFIDEIFGVGRRVRELLREIAHRPVSIGIQSRIDLWDEEGLDLLRGARCLSFECGVESVSEEGRAELNKNCRWDTTRIFDMLVAARARIPWVQANLIKTAHEDAARTEEWRNGLIAKCVWVSEPVPMFPFPGSPQYIETFGAPPDNSAWERAHAFYLGLFDNRDWSDVQQQNPLPLPELEDGNFECAC